MGEMGCLGGEIEYQAPDPVRTELKQSQVAQRLHILNAGDLSASQRIKCEIWENSGVRHMGEMGGWAEAEKIIKGEKWERWHATYGRNGWVGES